MAVLEPVVLPMAVRASMDRGIVPGRMRTGVIIRCARARLRCGGIAAGAPAGLGPRISRFIGRGTRYRAVGLAILVGHLFCLFLRARAKGKTETEGVKGGDPPGGKEAQETRRCDRDGHFAAWPPTPQEIASGQDGNIRADHASKGAKRGSGRCQTL